MIKVLFIIAIILIDSAIIAYLTEDFETEGKFYKALVTILSTFLVACSALFIILLIRN